MNKFCSRRSLLQINTGICLICLATGLLAADKPKKPMRETATVPADSHVLKRFGTIEDYLAEKRWIEAIDVLQEISHSEGRMLVLTKDAAANETTHRYVNVTTRCNILLSQLPPEGLAAYRKRVDPQARRWFDQWKQTRDVAELRRIVRHAFLSSYGDDALWALGEVAWDQGDFATAQLYWTQLVSTGHEVRSTGLPTVLRYPDSGLNPAEVLSRLVLCTLMEGEPDRAAKELQRFTEWFPTAEGTIAGRKGCLSEMLKQILNEGSQWDLQAGIREISTFALTPQRCGTLSSVVEIAAAKWDRRLTAPPERFNSSPGRGPLGYHPVVHHDIVFVNDAEKVWAWNVLTGEPAWPTERGTAEVYLPEVVDGARNPSQPGSGIPFFTMTIADGKLFARMGSSVTNPAVHELPTPPSDLICLDISTSQGKLVWKVASRELLKDPQKQWRFEGSPLVISGRLYVALSCFSAQMEFCVACLDAATGSLLWNRPIAATQSPVDDNHNRISHLLLTAGAGKLFFSTDAGAIVAISADDGRLEWALTYESPNPPQIGLLNHVRQGLVPAMFYEGYLFVAPNDCDRLFCIEADSGQVRWQQTHPNAERWRHLLGVVPGGESGRLIVSGDSLWSLDIHSNGKRIFGPKSSWGATPHPADRGYGRGIVAGNVIYWPTHEAIKIVDATTGETRESRSLRSPQAIETGGNLILAQDMLLVAQQDRLVAYCEYSLLKQRLERELSDRMSRDPTAETLADAALPRDGHARRLTKEEILGQLADIEVATGHVDAAVVALHKAIQSAEHDNLEQAQARFRNRLQELLHQSARSSLAKGDTKEARERLTEARQLIVDPAETAELLMEMGGVELTRGRPVAAVEVWQEIIEDDRMCGAPYRHSTAGEAASAAISRLVSEQGRGVFLTVELRAAAKISELMKAEDLDGLRNAVRQFPNSEAAAKTWKYFATLEREKGRLQGAMAIQARLMRESITPYDRAVTMSEWADLLDAAGYWRTAQRAWKELASKELMNEKIPFDGTSVRAEELAHDRLRRAEYKPYEPGEPAVPMHLDRVWSIPLDSQRDHAHRELVEAASRNSNVIVPLHGPPAEELACLLIRPQGSHVKSTDTEWVCVDRRTGRIRWKQSFGSAPRWAAYGETCLFLATDTKLSAVTLEEGRELWTTPLVARADSDHHPGVADGVASKLPPQIQLAVRGHLVFSFDPRTGLTAIDGRTGQVIWTFVPPRGKLQRVWTCGSRQIALQTLHASVTWLVNVSSELKFTERFGMTEPWLQGPIINDDGTMVLVTEDRQIESRSKDSTFGRRFWKYQGGMSYANTNPVLWSAPGQLLLIVDGTTLAGVNQLTGRPDWTTGLADLPVDNPASQVVAVGDDVYAASHGLLRRISLQYGHCEWERYLGASTEQWQVADCGATIATWSIPSRVRSGEPAVVTQFVVWCDARTGRILQCFSPDKGERVINVIGGPHDCIVQTERTVTGFHVRSELTEQLSAAE